MDVQSLETRTEGWISGLHLAALSLRNQAAEHRSAIVNAFSGSHRHRIDFLAQEVLAEQPPEIHGFVYQTAILDQLTAPLCDAVTGRQADTWLLGSLLALALSKLLSDAVGQVMPGAPLSFRFSLSGVGLWLVIVIALSAVASLIPARSASRLTVREVLAYESYVAQDACGPRARRETETTCRCKKKSTGVDRFALSSCLRYNMPCPIAPKALARRRTLWQSG